MLARIRVGVAVAVLAVGGMPVVAHGQGAEKAFGAGLSGAAGAAVPLLLLPSNVGPEIRFSSKQVADFRFVLGWPMQIPLPFGRSPTLAHRLLLAPELAIGTSDHAWFRARGGYRFGWRMLVVGMAVGGDKTAFFVTPELGLRWPSRAPTDDFGFGGLLDLRCDFEPSTNVVRFSLMLGWVFV